MRSSKVGSISYHATDILIGIVMAAVFAVAIVVCNNQESVYSMQKDNSASRRVLLQTPQEKLDFIRAVLEGNNATMNLTSKLPTSASEVAGLKDQEDADPIVRAADWCINEDSVSDEMYLPLRYALAVVYYNNDGLWWRRKRYWLSSESHCDWFGVGCCSQFLALPACANVDPNIIIELDLYSNNVSGDLHDILALFTDLRSAFFSKNKITGPINSNAFRSLPNLLKLYLQHNKLTGTIPSNIRDINSIDTLYVQGNNLNGSWPLELCGRCPSCPGGVEYFGMDCEEVTCPSKCCRYWEHCYYGNS